MTLGSLMNWGSFSKPLPPPSIERYHSGSSSHWDHKSHGHGGWKSGGGGGKGGGNGAALSALTLLAFLFLMNVMQQSMQANNATMAAPGTTTLLLREGRQVVALNAGAETNKKSLGNNDKQKTLDDAEKGDTFSRYRDYRDYV